MTWLKANVPDSENFTPGIPLSRNDRDSRIGGGTLVNIRDGLPYCVRSDLQAPNVESCVVEINRAKARKLFIFTLYKAPDRKLEHFIESLSNVVRTVPTEAVL